jgi:hypothetical protein
MCFLAELWCLEEELTMLICDNLSSIKLVSNFAPYEKMKHIELEHHYIRKKIKTKRK